MEAAAMFCLYKKYLIDCPPFFLPRIFALDQSSSNLQWDTRIVEGLVCQYLVMPFAWVWFNVSVVTESLFPNVIK